MTLLLDAPPGLRGDQCPRVRSVPSYVSSTGPEAVELADLAGLRLDPWQQFVLTESLGERADGQWAAFEVGLLVSRQNGKGGVLEARELAGLFLLGERLLIHSAHQFDTSLEAFRRLLDLVEGTPELSRRLKGRPSHAHGKEGFELLGGQRIRFRTRTKGGGRGFTGDCLILDEAMDIPESTHAALLPTLSARPNPQVWYTGSAVDQEQDDNGVVFARIRERGLRGDDPSLAYFEWSAPLEVGKVTPADTENPVFWAAANPALGIRITPEYVGNERAAMGTRKFAVERLGVGDWPVTSEQTARIIPRQVWTLCEDVESKPVEPFCFAFDVTPDRSTSTIGVAGDRADGLTHVEVVDQRPGTGWVVDRIADLVRRRKTWAVVCDPTGPAGSLVSELEQVVGRRPSGESKLVQLSAREHSQGCGLFYDAVLEGRLRHLGTTELEMAVDGAAKRQLGDIWLWDRKSSTVDISPLVACTLAAFENFRRPRSRPRVVNLNRV